MPRLNMASHLIREIPLKVLHKRSGDEHVTLLQACYENPLYEEDVKEYASNHVAGQDFKASSQDHRKPPRPDRRAPGLDHHKQSRGLKDYMHCRPPHPHEQITFKPPKSPRKRRFWIIVFGLLAVTIVAIIIGVLATVVGK